MPELTVKRSFVCARRHERAERAGNPARVQENAAPWKNAAPAFMFHIMETHERLFLKFSEGFAASGCAAPANVGQPVPLLTGRRVCWREFFEFSFGRCFTFASLPVSAAGDTRFVEDKDAQPDVSQMSSCGRPSTASTSEDLQDVPNGRL